MHPEWSDSEVDDAVRRSYTSKDPDKRARQRGNLQPGNSRRKRQGQPATTPKRKQPAKLGDVDIVTFAEHPDYLGLDLHPAQRVILKAVYGLQMDEAETALYQTLTQENAAHGPTCEALEAILCLGARSGKSFLTAIVALYEAIVRGDHWRQFLQPGEVGYAVIVATRMQQAVDVIQANCARLLSNSPKLSEYLAEEPTQARLRLTNGLEIISLPCNSRAGRGLPIFFLALDEAAHFYCEGARADTDIYNSLAPRLAQFPQAKTVLISTPAARQGLFWRWFAEGFDVPQRVTIQAPTTAVNPTVDAAFLERMKARDIDNYLREFGAEFADRLAAFFAGDALANAFQHLGDLPRKGARHYALGIDQSGLSGRDRFAAAVAHKESNGLVVVDAIRSWATTDLDRIMADIGALASEYGITRAYVDAYAGGWTGQALKKVGISSEKREALPKIYINTKSLMNGGKLDLPENGELRAGLENTQAFYGRNNSLSIAHERTASGHADVADASVTAIWAASKKREHVPIHGIDIRWALKL